MDLEQGLTTHIDGTTFHFLTCLEQKVADVSKAMETELQWLIIFVLVRWVQLEVSSEVSVYETQQNHEMLVRVSSKTMMLISLSVYKFFLFIFTVYLT